MFEEYFVMVSSLCNFPSICVIMLFVLCNSICVIFRNLGLTRSLNLILPALKTPLQQKKFYLTRLFLNILVIKNLIGF